MLFDGYVCRHLTDSHENEKKQCWRLATQPSQFGIEILLEITFIFKFMGHNIVYTLNNEFDLLKAFNKLHSKYFPEESRFTLDELFYYANPNNADDKYASFDIPKKSGGYRHIFTPCIRLKRLQTYSYYVLQSMYEEHYNKVAMGFIHKRSIVTNARKHIRRNFVYNIDLQDFFTSIEMHQVWKSLCLPPLKFPDKISMILAGLCCIKLQYELDSHSLYKYVLPQGAPSSPILSNIVCADLDNKLTELSNTYKLTYTRYADDITFSGMENVFEPQSPFIETLKEIIEECNFHINKKKIRLQGKWERQKVTGLVVNNTVNVGRKYIRELRSLLYIWEKYSYKIASDKFAQKKKKKKSYNKNELPSLENSIKGKLNYIRMVRGNKNKAYIKMMIRFNRLVENIK